MTKVPNKVDLALPRIRFLSNGRYTVMLNARGRGFSKYSYFALSRWSGDWVEDREGYFCYLRDLDDGMFWSLGAPATLRPTGVYQVEDEPGSLRLCHVRHGIEAQLKVCVPPEEDMEVRRVSLRNLSDRARVIEVTGFLEVVLNHPMAHAAHPAFSKLFVQTEFLAEEEALLVRRRPRGHGDVSPWMINALFGPGALQFETDRARFVGRGYRDSAPRALCVREALSGSTGNVLDPALVMRRIVQLPPGGSSELSFVLGAAATREEAIVMLRRYRSGGGSADALRKANGRERDLWRQLDLAADEALCLQALAGAMFTTYPGLGAPAEVLRRATGSFAILTSYGLPTDRPFAVVCSRDSSEEGSVSRLVKAQRYWRALGLDTALLVLTGEAHDPSPVSHTAEGPIFSRHLAEIPQAHLDVILSAARLVVGEKFPALCRMEASEVNPPGSEYDGLSTAEPSVSSHRDRRQDGFPESMAGPAAGESERARGQDAPGQALLLCDNGFGGFSEDGSEYVIRLSWGPQGLHVPPLPWINVIANEQFGLLISETGAGYTWSRNSREHRLTPWSNDPVLDTHGEALYLRDEETGDFWSPLPGPCPAPQSYETRHGFGYSCFSHRSSGLKQETTVFVTRHDPIKITRLSLSNQGSTRRHLSVFCYQRLVLGTTPSESSRFVVTSHDEDAHAIFAENRLIGEFADGIMFSAVSVPDEAQWHFTADRQAFIGHNGSPEQPQALLSGEPLNGKCGVGLDPCCAHQIVIELEPGESKSLNFLLGETLSEAQARILADRYRQVEAVDRAFSEITAFWCDTLSAIRIETPSPAIDLMVNGWLVYQTLACRMWARSAFYQSGGAFGYRDQLQDAAALIYLRPDLTRSQILLHAAHQFVEGDVLHWWHAEPLERGLRTRFSDDLNWLPYVAAFYVKTTGDWSVLDERVPFLTARLLEEGEDEAYLKPLDSGQSAEVYEHCCRALDRSLTQGAHGLPLMGTGDWNDGMNRVGWEGRGESVWMGFFLYYILGEFLPLCEQRGDQARIERYRRYRDDLKSALNEAGWDGEWYRRAFYDDGTPLGSKHSDECRIDALAQAWAVISRAAPLERAKQAMDAVEKHLISEKEGLIRLLTPPFVNTPHDPGYIKGYVAGVRENGGQYTHAACWVVKAVAELGRSEQAARLLEMLSPISHALTAEAAAIYKLEPYVIAADVYGEPPHCGRGGWSWYTGSAGWMYRVALESVLGFSVEDGETVSIKPCIPAGWSDFRIRYRLVDGKTSLVIEVKNPKGGCTVVSAQLDGQPLSVEDGVARIPLLWDGQEHQAKVVLGSDVSASSE